MLYALKTLMMNTKQFLLVSSRQLLLSWHPLSTNHETDFYKFSFNSHRSSENFVGNTFEYLCNTHSPLSIACFVLDPDWSQPTKLTILSIIQKPIVYHIIMTSYENEITFFKGLSYFYLHLYMCIDTHGHQKRSSDLLELEMQAFVSSSTWVLGPEPLTSVRVTNALNHQTLISSAGNGDILDLIRVKRGCKTWPYYESEEDK